MTTASTYNIELRDKSGNLKQYLTPWASNVRWEWNRIGGCGAASMTIKKEYRDIEFGPHDDIQIRLKSGATSKLVYRGFIEKVNPSLKIGQDISLNINGYSELLRKIIVHDNGIERAYSGTEVSAIVTDIIDTFVTVNSSITKGTIDASDIPIDELKFKCSVDEALRTLADLCGNVEYGVDEDLVFFWRNESASIRQKFFVGNNVELFERRFDWQKLINKIVFEGATVNDVVFTRTAESEDSQDFFYLAESIYSNSAITTSAVADQYLGALLKAGNRPVLNIRVKIPNTALRLEDTVPIGLVGIYDVDYDSPYYIVGESGDGGSDLTVGEVKDGGDGAVVGSYYSDQVSRLAYSLSDTDERVNLEIQFGNSLLETAAKIKQIELNLSNLRQR